MTPEISEKAFEDAIERVLLAGGPDAEADGFGPVAEPGAGYGEGLRGGYRRADASEYDRHLCLLPRDLFDFIYATQPDEWKRLSEHYGDDVKSRFLTRLAREVDRRGTLDVLRNGVKDRGCRFRIAFFRPSSGLNEELRTLYEANQFTVVRQLRYSEHNENSLDITLFLNGLPIFTAELKTPFTRQTVEDAIHQYRLDRDPREPLFQFGRCLAHFAVDPDLVYVATKLEGRQTRFLPFNQGYQGGAGNRPVPPTEQGYATAYLWERIWARDSVLNLVQHFVHAVEEDAGGRGTGHRELIFPRYHQLDAVRRLIRHAAGNGTGHRYLIQHSAGSGKSNSIAWLAHQLSVLHDADDRRVFDSIIVITDRRVLDRQLQRTVRHFEQTEGVVENIDRTSRQLKAALESGKTIIVSTLQKFPVIADDMGALESKRFAVIIDEAHSSQSGESTRSLNRALSTDNLEEAAAEEEDAGEDIEDRIVRQMRERGPQPNVSTFAFTATPKDKTLELFGTRQEDGSFTPFSLYSMRQAIEEGFILDVLEHYTTYTSYWRLLKTIEDDPRYDKSKAGYLLKAFVDLHEHSIGQKLEIMFEHFHGQIAHRIAGRAKAMIVTRSRLHAVRYKRALDALVAERGYPYGVLVAFSGTVRDGGIDYTEASMNGFSDTQTAKRFDQPEHRFLIVANKFQTGFDQPLLHTMYVDKKLGGVNAVQTLSRLNRTHPDKKDTVVLDFANEAHAIKAAFDPYYERTILSEETDPNLLYDLEQRLYAFHVFSRDDVEEFAEFFFDPATSQDRLYGVLRPVLDALVERGEEERQDFRGALSEYVRLFAFLSQVLTFADADLERLYVFARLLRRYLPEDRVSLPREIQEKIDIESYRIQETFSGPIALDRGAGRQDPRGAKESAGAAEEEMDVLSRILEDLNERFSTDFTDDDLVSIRALEETLAGDRALAASLRANTRENARLTFEHVANDRLQGLVESNFKLYKKISDDPEFSKYFLDLLFERLLKGVE